MLSPFGNGHQLGATSADVRMDRETGASRGCLALAGGAQRRRGRATGRFGAARPGKAPSISYMEGALLRPARPRRFLPGRG
jgi:hypothetical protein